MKTPNLIVSLTPSFDTRGVDPNANIVADVDQRVVNGYYELLENPLNGSKTAFLTKRPGIAQAQGYSYTAHGNSLIGWEGSTTGTSYNPQIFTIHDSKVKAVNATGSSNITLIDPAGDYRPMYTDQIQIGSNIYSVVQVSQGGIGTQRVFFSISVGTWTEITDAEFTGLKHAGKMEFMDGYAFVLDHTNKIYQSDLNNISSWAASNFFQRIITADQPAGLARLKNQLLAFGQESVEVFYNAGNATGSVLGRLPHLHAKIGLSDSPATSGTSHYYCIVNDRLFFIGKEAGRTGAGGAVYSKNTSLFMFDGNRFEKIDHPMINKVLSSNPIYGVYSVSINSQIAVALALTQTNEATQRWLMFFPSTNSWAEWSSTEFSPINNGTYFLGTNNASTQYIYAFDDVEQFQDGTTGSFVNYPFSVSFQIPGPTGLPRKMPYCGITADTARSATSLTLEKSTDDYQTWTNIGTLDLTKSRKAKYGIGTFNELALRLSYTGANPVRIREFYATID